MTGMTLVTIPQLKQFTILNGYTKNMHQESVTCGLHKLWSKRRKGKTKGDSMLRSTWA